MDPAEAALPNERQREGCRRIRANPRLKPDDLLPDRQMRQGAINCALAAGRAYLADPFAAIPPDPSAPSLRVTCVTVTRFTNCRIY
jgi:hypothetical protein